MKKIPSLFKRDYEGTRLVYDEVVEGTEWVLADEGVATVKYDGTACLIREGVLYKRYELKQGKKIPVAFLPAQDADPVTGDIPGWVPVLDAIENRWHTEAFLSAVAERGGNKLPDGTYELVGPKVQGNPSGFGKHLLIPHGATILEDVPRDFEGIREYLQFHPDIEGIIWWRNPDDPDCDKAKIKRKDFGYPWPPKK